MCVSAKPVNNNPFQLYCRPFLSLSVEKQRGSERKKKKERGSIKYESNELEKVSREFAGRTNNVLMLADIISPVELVAIALQGT